MDFSFKIERLTIKVSCVFRFNSFNVKDFHLGDFNFTLEDLSKLYNVSVDELRILFSQRLHFVTQTTVIYNREHFDWCINLKLFLSQKYPSWAMTLNLWERVSFMTHHISQLILMRLFKILLAHILSLVVKIYKIVDIVLFS